MLNAKVGSCAALGIASLVWFSNPTYAADYSAQKAEILRIEQEMAAAQDEAPVMKYYDPKILLDDIVPGEWRGSKTVADHLTAEFAAVKNLKTEIVQISVDADNNLAFAYSIQHVSWTDAQSGKPVDIITRQSDMYHRVGNKWLMVYQHSSFPVEFKTGQAELHESLKPKSKGF